MFTKLVSLILSFVMAFTGFISTTFNEIVDSVSEMFFGIPYTLEAIKSDFFDDISNNDIVMLDADRGFINNKIVVFVDPEISFSRKVDLFATCGGVLSGWCTPADLYVISYPVMNYDQVLNKCEALEKKDGVELSIPVIVQKTENNLTPTDTFDATEENPIIWDEIVPNGSNWWLEAIDARQAWDYSNMFKKMSVGLVDSGFDTEHVDLAGKIRFPDDKQAGRNVPDMHGTHVAGIVSANHNGTGIAGVCNNSELVCVDWMPDLLQFWSTDIAIFFGLSTLVKAGAKVINFSLGTSSSKTSNSSGFIERVFETAATSYMMASLLSKGYDFVVIQSAGNGDAFGDPIDAKNNGHFAALTESNIFTGSKNVSKQDILGRIITVASASNDGDGTFTQSDFSNVGRNVSIAAPGEEIYSCSIDGAYETLSGTSMSAPIVTGVAALVWSVNPSFSGAQVKDIVCTSTDTVAEIYTEEEYYYDLELTEYPMVNAKLAVEEAIRRSDSSIGTVSGKIIGSAETIVYKDVSHTVYSDGTYSFVAPEGTDTAEIFDRYGNSIGTFELTVTAGQTAYAEDYNVECI